MKKGPRSPVVLSDTFYDIIFTGCPEFLYIDSMLLITAFKWI